MTPRTKHQGHWYEASATSAGPNGTKWQGEVTIGEFGPNGHDVVLLSGFLVPGYFDTEPEARNAAAAYAREYLDRL